MGEVMLHARQTLKDARARSASDYGIAMDRARTATSRRRREVQGAFSEVGLGARRAVRTAATDTEALMREIAGQGPAKTLERGFAVVRASSGEPIASAAAAATQETLRIEFKDGAVQTAVKPAPTPKRSLGNKTMDQR